MINVKFNEQAKALGAKWNGSRWVAPELAEAEFAALEAKYNQDLVAVELTVTQDNRDSGAWLGTSHAVAIGGYVVATANGRDSGARLADGVAVVSGGFTSGGSVKNYRCLIKNDEARIRCKIARAMLEEIGSIEGVDLVVMEDDEPKNPKNERTNLLARRAALLAELEAIDKELGIETVAVVAKAAKPIRKAQGVMARAWVIAREMAKEFGGKVRPYISSALKSAWSDVYVAA